MRECTAPSVVARIGRRQSSLGTIRASRVVKSRSFGRREFLVGAGSVAAVAAGAAIIASRGSDSTVQLTPLEHLLTGQPLEVLIVGSGPAGAILAVSLAEAGIASAIIESGTDPGSPGGIGDLDAYMENGPVEYSIASAKVRGLGGTSRVWTGRCSRFHPIDFEPNAYTPAGAEWPVTYSELEPYYDQAERSLRVRGGSLSEFHAPRSRDLPFAYSRGISDLKSMLAEVGVTVDRAPTSQVGILNRDALRIGRDVLPDYSNSGLGMVAAGVVATGVIVAEDGQALGVRVRDYAGTEGVIQADKIVLACGAIENARLLMLSEFFGELKPLPPLTGRSFMEHPHLNFNGSLKEERLAHFQLGRSMQFYEEFKQSGSGSVDFGFYGGPQLPFLRIGTRIEMMPSSFNRFTLSNQKTDAFGNPGFEMQMRFQEQDLSTMQEVRIKVGQIFGDLGITDFQEVGRTWGHHHMGTCRMGANPETSVVDPDLRLHGTSNLYVLGSSAFVTSGAAHPTLLLVALGHRLADHLTTRMAALLVESDRRAAAEPIGQ